MASQLPFDQQIGLSQTFQAYQRALNEAAIVSITDTSGRIIYVNDKFIEISGYSANELIGKTHQIINSHHHPDSFFKEMWQTISSGKNWRAEIKKKAKNGSFYWVDTVIAPVVDDQGIIIQYLSIRNVITSQKENEEKLISIRNELIERNRLFRDSQKLARLGNWYLNISTNMLEWSDETYHIFELPPGTPVNYEFFLQMVHPQDRVAVNQAWNQATLTGQYEIEHRIVTISGEKFVKEWARFSFNGSKYPVSAMGIVQDITEKKHAEIDLIRSNKIIEESEQKFRAITNQATEGIALADTEGHYQFVNPALCLMTGYSEKELLKMTVFDLTAKSQPHSIFFESKGEKERLPVEVNLRRKDGSEFMTEIIGTNIEISGHQLVLGTVRDISERKSAENKLLASEIRYRRLFESAKDGIMIIDAASGVIQDLNPFVLTLLPYSEQELVGRQLWKVDFLKDICNNKDGFYSFAKKEYARYENLFLGAREGSPLWVELMSNKYDVNGKQVIQLNIRDITARKLAEEKLKKSESQYKDLVENISDLICTHDLDGRILSMNPAAEKALGIQFNPSESLNIRDVLVGKFRKDFDEYIAGICQQGHMTGLMKVRTRSGDIRLWEYSNSLKTTGATQVVRGYARDITEQKRAEANLKQTKERMAGIVNNIPVGILLQGPSSEILFSNESARSMLRLTEEELLGKTSLDTGWNTVHEDGSVFPGKDHPVSQAIARKEPIKNVTMGVYRTASQDMIWLLVNAIPELGANGKVKTVICAFSDITELKKAGEELRKNQVRFQAMVENIDSIITLTDKNFNIIYRSPSAERIIGWSKHELAENKFLNMTHPEDINTVRKNIEDLLNKPGILLPITFRMKNKKGQYVSLEGTSVNLLNDKHIKAIVINLRDVTERKIVEEEVKHTTEQLRHLAAHLQRIREEERKRIGREIHDELGQQLTAIKMDIAWINKKAQFEIPAVKNKLNNVIELLDGSSRAIRRILSELRPGILDERDFLESMEWLGRQLAANTNISVQFTTNKTEINLPEAISNCLFRVCQEAYTNITRHSRADRVSTSISIDNGWITLKIEDNGKGFDVKTVQKKRTFGILGMKERVLSLDGRFELNSSSGNGTAIIIRLPLPAINNLT